MTFKQKMMQLLQTNGMFESQAEEVMKLVSGSDTLVVDELPRRLDDNIEDYPAIMVQLVWGIVKPIALQWINENIPQAWYKPMFLPTEELNDFLIKNNRSDLIK